MISEFNTSTSSPTGSGNGLKTLVTLLVVSVAIYMGYKYFIAPQKTEKPNENG